MARKKDVLKKIDIKTKSSGAPLPLIQEDQPVPPAFYLVSAPDTLVELGQANERSAQAPLVSVAIGWNEAPNVAPSYYLVEYSKDDPTFTEPQRRIATSLTATINGLVPSITYYFRVQAVVGSIYSPYSETLAVLTMSDTRPPPDVNTLDAVYENSDLHITYTYSHDEGIKDFQIDIYDSAGSILYDTIYTAAEQYVWTAERNIFLTAGVPLTSAKVQIHARSWANVLSTGDVSVIAIAPLPSTPTGYESNWITDTGIADEAFVTSWLGAANANDYQLTIDSRDYFTRDLNFTYNYEQNVDDHRPTLASGNPSFNWLLQARDKLGQVSDPVNITVTNAAPPSGIMNITINAGFATLGVTVGLLASTIVQDFDHFEWRVWNGSSYVRTINTPDPSVIFDLSSNGVGTYTPSVTMIDKFNQRSATVSGAPTLMDVLTIDQLRAETTYTDWLGTAANVLLRLKDGVLYDGSGAYVFYAANAGWQWLEAQRPLLDRYKTITFSAFWGAGLLLYYEVDTPTGTVYYAGPVTVSANGSYAMTRYTVLATAQTNAYAFSIAGNGTKRFDFTQIEESRRIRVWFKDTASTTGIYEYYARRLVQSDDIEAESIRSINIAALGINADRIFATSLSAFTANMGSLHIDSLLDIATSGIIFQGTGSGTLTQNATTPTSFSVTGLKLFNSGGVGKLSTYNAGVEQITLDTDGKLKWGAGTGIMDASGIKIIQGATVINLNSVQLTKANATTIIGRYGGGYSAGTAHGLFLESMNVDAEGSFIDISARSASGAAGDSIVYLRAAQGVSEALIQISNNGSAGTISISAPAGYITQTKTKVNGRLSVNSTVAATRGLSIFGDNEYVSWNNAAGTEKWVAGLETASSGRFAIYNTATGVYGLLFDATNTFAQFNSIGAGIAGQTNVRIYARGQDSTSSNYALYADNSGGGLLFAARNDGNVYISSDLYSNSVKVVGQRITGWATPTGTTTKTTFATTTVTTQQLAEHVKGLIEDLKTHGLLGA